MTAVRQYDAAHRRAAHPDDRALAPAPGGCIDDPALEAILRGGLARIPLYHGITYGTIRGRLSLIVCSCCSSALPPASI